MYHLLEAVMILFKDTEENIKLPVLFQKLNKGQYYQKLKQQNPIWLLTNRQTAFNIKIIITSVLLKVAKKMTFQEIKQVIMIFTLQQRKTGSKGIPLNPRNIIWILRHLNRTISITYLQSWIKANKFQIQNYILAHEFLYLSCLCSDRSSYLRLLPKPNYRSQRNPHTNLYQMQSIKQIIGTPDSKIQQKLRETINDSFQIQDSKQNEIQGKTSKKVSLMKSYKNLSHLQKMLRDATMYSDIKRCLKSRQKSPKLIACVTTVKNTNRAKIRPQTTIHKLKIQQIINKDISYFDFVDKNETEVRTSTVGSNCESRILTKRNTTSYSTKSLKNIVKRETDKLNDKIKRSAFCRSENLMI